MDFKSSDQHQENRYCNARTILSSLSELQHFNSKSESPTEWENGRKELAKLSDEEFQAFKDIIVTMCNVYYNIQVDTDYTAYPFYKTLERFFTDIAALRKKEE